MTQIPALADTNFKSYYKYAEIYNIKDHDQQIIAHEVATDFYK